MGHTFSNMLVHVIFSTKNRQPTIVNAIGERLYAYMAGVARNEFGWARRIGGTSDHIHGLIELRTDVSIAHAMNRWKSLSSGWVHKTFPEFGDFAWQSGYGVFSVSSSRASDVIAYIDAQVEHHTRRSFEEEFLDFLNRHGIQYDPERVWKWRTRCLCQSPPPGTLSPIGVFFHGLAPEANMSFPPEGWISNCTLQVLSLS